MRTYAPIEAELEEGVNNCGQGQNLMENKGQGWVSGQSGCGACYRQCLESHGWNVLVTLRGPYCCSGFA